METTQPSARRTPIVPGAPDTSTPISTQENTHNSADFQAFLTHFDGLLTYQTFDDRKADKTLARILHNPTPEQLRDLNARGAGVFLTINQTDGRGRERGNITKIRAFFADFDGAELPATWPLEPSLITETSAGKFHVYWFLATGNDVLLSNDAWNDQQKQIARVVGAQLNDCTGLNRVMRVPGFLHQKTETPFLSRILTTTGQRYDLADITAAFPVPIAEPAPYKYATVTDVTTKLDGRRGVQQKYALKAMQEECEKLANTAEGNRNNVLNGTAYRVGRLVGGGHLDQDEARQALLDAARAAGMHDERDQLLMTLDRGFYAGIGEPDYLDHVGTRTKKKKEKKSAPVTAEKAAPVVQVREHTDDQDDGETLPSVEDILDQMPEKPQLQHYRDLVLAQIRENGDHYRYHQTWRSWWRYENGVYVEVNDEKMAQTVDCILQSHGHIVKNTMVTEVLIKLSREPGIGSAATDQGPWELNTKNGILDMKTGDFRPHTPEYFSIIQSAASYDPGKKPRQWLKFLSEAVPDKTERELLQMFSGYSATGDTSAQKALFVVGDGGTGKSTYTRVLSAVLGGLATSSAIENIQDGSFGLSELVGKRMCVVSEMPKRIDWLSFKRVTGEDKITVDVKYKAAYTTKLDIKLVVLSNILPLLGDDAENTSLTRRILPISFNVTPKKRDPQLEKRLTSGDELSGILNWMLDGLRMLQKRGMQFPASTNTLSRDIVEASNPVVRFLAECCAFDADNTVSTPASEVYTAYQQWCIQNNIRPVNGNRFPNLLLAAGRFYSKTIEKQRKNTGIQYQYLKIAAGNANSWQMF